MSHGTASVNPLDLFDPWGIAQQMRDACLESTARTMAEIVNTEAYAQWTGATLDAYLGVVTPLRSAIDQVMPHLLAVYGIPSRDEVTTIAARMTHIEMRLDDMEMKLQEIARALRVRD